MIVVTGAAGFIGSVLTVDLIKNGLKVLAVDKFKDLQKNANLRGVKTSGIIDRENFHSWLDENHSDVEQIYHIGARTDTGETDRKIFDRLNLEYSKKIFIACTKYKIPLLYASSAATYGNGKNGFSDKTEPKDLQPLNEYARSKNEFDKWVAKQEHIPPQWYGIKFFNVYGPNEYHKGSMASVVFHAFKQVSTTGKLKLFRSHHSGIRDGEQKRDFICVNDIITICRELMKENAENGIYNAGTGKARTFKALAEAVFDAMSMPVNIEYIPTPVKYRKNYQYFTEADIDKTENALPGFEAIPLERGISDFINIYLSENPIKYYQEK